MSLDSNVIKIVRRTESVVSTVSEFTAGDNTLTGYILEERGPSTRIPNQEQRIPPGTYTLRWHTSPRFRATLPHLYNEQVPRERYILIHAGNTAADTEGCLLPGKTFTKDSVGSSRAMLAELIEFFRSRGIENVSLVIEEDFR